MEMGQPHPTWGRVDAASSKVALSIAVPLAIVVSIAILAIGAIAAPKKSPGRAKQSPYAPIWRILRPSADQPLSHGVR